MANQLSQLKWKDKNYPYLDFQICSPIQDNNFINLVTGSWCIKPEVKRWIKENIRGGWHYVVEATYNDGYRINLRFYFTNRNSLLFFKMRFG